MHQSSWSGAGAHMPCRAILIAICLALVWPQALLATPGESACPNRPLQEIIGVAHNAGNSIASIDQAVRAGADLIELDLREHRGRLVSSHFPVITIVEWEVFGTLDAWSAAQAATGSSGLLLDLKQGDPHFLDLVSALIDQIPAGTRMYVSSPDLHSLVQLKVKQPILRPLLTINTDLTLAALMATGPSPFLGGVSVRYDLLDESVTSWMCAHGLDVFAWPVDDAEIALTLIAMGVSGITSGNPTILRALASERTAGPPASGSTAWRPEPNPVLG